MCPKLYFINGTGRYAPEMIFYKWHRPICARNYILQMVQADMCPKWYFTNGIGRYVPKMTLMLEMSPGRPVPEMICYSGTDHRRGRSLPEMTCYNGAERRLGHSRLGWAVINPGQNVAGVWFPAHWETGNQGTCSGLPLRPWCFLSILAVPAPPPPPPLLKDCGATGICQWPISTLGISWRCAALDMPEWREMTEQIIILASKATFESGLLLEISEVLRSLRHYLRAQSQGHCTVDILEERGVERGSTRRSSLKGERKGHPQADEH